MIKTDNTIPNDMLDILRSCKGKTLDLLLGTDFKNQEQTESFQIVILRFKDFDLELWNKEQPNKDRELSDIVKISVRINRKQNCRIHIAERDKNGILSSRGFDQIIIGQLIEGITVYNERVHSFDRKGSESFILTNTYAIVFSLGKQYLHIVKELDWSEMWTVSLRQTAIPAPSQEWVDDDESTYKVYLSSVIL